MPKCGNMHVLHVHWKVNLRILAAILYNVFAFVLYDDIWKGGMCRGVGFVLCVLQGAPVSGEEGETEVFVRFA
jgi:hypothetical protein